MHMNRRDFIKCTSYSASLALAASHFSLMARASKLSMGRIVVIGGGYAGATVAKYLRMWSLGALEVIVVEKNSQFVSCPLSNLVIGGSKTIDELTFGYDLLKSHHGIKWVQDTVMAIDTSTKKITLQRGELNYDRLVIAPGIDFIYDDLPMLQSAEAQSHVPHAWKAGWQTVNLRQQLEAMPDGGVFVMNVPKAPYRCPPGPYERAAQVAYYFKQHKPRSKVIVLDANGEMTSKKSLFTKVFNETYAGLVDYRPNSGVTEVDVGSKTAKTEFETVKADVLNIIPPQRAGKPAQLVKTADGNTGLNNIDRRWCEVDFLSYESKLARDIHVIGDAISSALPKSAHMATNQAKICANAIVQLMAGGAPDSAPVFANTCYSYISDSSAMHVAHVYRYDEEKKAMIAAEGGGLSLKPSVQEGQYAATWAQSIWADSLT